MNINEIMEYLPHRYPMLLVDRIVDVEPGVRAVGIKNVTINEPFFGGHYPEFPIMPGVLIIEAIAQAGAVILLSSEEYKGLFPIIGAVESAKFRRPVVPGDVLRSEVELLWIKSSIGKLRGNAYVEGELVCSIELTFKLSRGLKS